MNGPAKHVDFLDHTRGLAIIAVLLFHSLATAYGYAELPWHGWFRGLAVPASFLWFLPLSFGQAGVAIFFVVSGFCIQTSFQRPGRRWRDFFIRRFFRIYPAYLAALLIFSLLLQMGRDTGTWLNGGFWLQVLTHLFLVHNFLPRTYFGINGSFWSLAVEAQLYLVFPALLFLAARLGWRRTMAGLGGLELLIRSLDGLVQTAGWDTTLGGRIVTGLAASPLGYWFSWALGAWLAEAWIKDEPAPLARSSPAGWLALAVGCNFVKFLAPFGFPLFALATAAMIGRRLDGGAAPVRAPGFLMELLKKTGWWSYSLYLLHEPLLQVYSYAVDWLFPGASLNHPLRLLLIVCTWPAILLAGFLWHELFERPGIAQGKQIIQGTGGAAGTVDAADRRRQHRLAGLLAVMVVGTYWVAAQLNPQDAMRINTLAWALATSPEAADRNGPLAVKLAEDACWRTRHRLPVMVGTLAAAYAEAGRFDEAISTAQQACELASQAGNQKLLRRYQAMLGFYVKHQPYHEPPGTANTAD
jgi:peptidoglycan/LPS O-acetylase OafA/YrhL